METGGNVFCDGSRKPSFVKGLARAAAAIVDVDKDGKVLYKRSGAVPANLPQTAQAAEQVALALTVRCTQKREAVVSRDCAGVVNMANSTILKKLSAKAKYGGHCSGHLDRSRQTQENRNGAMGKGA